MLGAFLQRPAVKALLPFAALVLLLVLGWICVANVPKAGSPLLLEAQRSLDAANAAVKNAANNLQKAKTAATGAKDKGRAQSQIAKATEAASQAAGRQKAATSASDVAAMDAKANVASSSYFAWFGFLALGLLWIVSATLAGNPNPTSLAMGNDNRLSTSKMQMLVWTACVGFVYTMVYADRILMYGKVDPATQIPENVLFALGISATTAVAAKAITTSQIAADPTQKDGPQIPSYDPAALVRDDGASTASLTKVQILFWTVVAVVVYITNAFHGLGKLAACTQTCGFPDIDTTLTIFMGLGHATYLGGKLVQAQSPALAGVSLDAATSELILNGSGLGSSGSLVFDSVPVGNAAITSWTTTEIRFSPPSLDGIKHTMTVTVGGNTSPSITYSSPSAPAASAAAQSASHASVPATPRLARSFSASSPLPNAVDHQRVRGIDISDDDGEIDWDAAVRRGGIDFVYAQATYGSVPPKDDAQFDRNHDACKRLSIPFGAYHFLRFPHPGDEQARHFLQRVDGRVGTLAPMVDIELDSGDADSFVARVTCLSSFCAVVEKALRTSVIIYTNKDTWNTKMGGTDAFSGHRLWVANYTERPDLPPAMPGGWKTWTIFQYSASGPILPLATPSKVDGLDLDVLAGTLDEILLDLPRPFVGNVIAKEIPNSNSPPDGGGGEASVGGVAPSAPASRGVLASIVYNGISQELKGYDVVGVVLFAYDARNDSVSPKAWRPGAGCPPGSYTLRDAEANDPAKPCTVDNDWIGEGRWFIPITGIEGHDGIGIHGGGSCVTPPDPDALQPRQGWCATMNCIRMQNDDLDAVARMKLAGLSIRVVQPA